jgi:hypothetical protein
MKSLIRTLAFALVLLAGAPIDVHGQTAPTAGTDGKPFGGVKSDSPPPSSGNRATDPSSKSGESASSPPTVEHSHRHGSGHRHGHGEENEGDR